MCHQTGNNPVNIVWLAAVVILASHYVAAQAPLIRVAQGVVNGLDAYTPCTLIDGGSRLACATGVAASTPKVVTLYKDLYTASPSFDKTIDYGPTGWDSSIPTYIAGNSEQFFLVATENAVFLGNNQVEASGPIRPIRRLGGQTAVQPFFALFFSNRLVIATEHRYVPGLYLRAATIFIPSSYDYFIAAVLSLDDNVLLLTTKSMSIKKVDISVNALGRITATSALIDFTFEVSVPWRDVTLNNFYFVRERGPNYGAGGYREVFLSTNYDASRCDDSLCNYCSCPVDSKWYILTQSYSTPYCPGIRQNTYDSTISNSECAVFSPDLMTYAVAPCDIRTGYLYEDKNPTKFTPNCSASRNRGAPYLNTSFVQSSSLFTFPSGMVNVYDVSADAYGPAFSVPTFMAPSSYYSDATMVIVNGVVVVTAFLQGSDCDTGLRTTTSVGGSTAICAEAIRGTRFTVVIPLLGDPSIAGSPRRVKQFFVGKTSSYTTSYTASGARAFPQVLYRALDGGAVVASSGTTAAPLIPLLASSSSSRLVTAQQIANISFTQSASGVINVNGLPIDDVIDSNDILYVSQGQSSGQRVSLYKRPTQRILSSFYYFTTLVENQWFNESSLYATCATQIAFRVMVVNTALQGGVITSGLLQISNAPVYQPSSMVLDSVVTFSGSSGATVNIFSAPCTTATALTITLRLSANPSMVFSVSMTLLPGGQPPPTTGPTPVPTPAPPPPPTRTQQRDTITATLTAIMNSASLSTSTTAVQTRTETLQPTLSQRRTQSEVQQSITRTATDATKTPLHVTPEPTISTRLPVFPPLPDNATNWTQVVPPQLPFPANPVATLHLLSTSSPPPGTYVVRVTLPFAGVGQLFTRIAPSVAFGSILTTHADGTEILLRATNASQALTFINASIAVVVNPEVAERNLTGRIPVNVTVWGEDVQLSLGTIRVVGWASWVYPLSNSVPINRGPQISPSINCSRSVMRGGRFDLSLGSIITHPLSMPLTMSVFGAGQQLTIPASIRVDCNVTGSCSIRGVATDDNPIQYRVGGSDGYFAVFASCTLFPFYVSLRPSQDVQQPLVMSVKAASPFVLTIPLDMFVSSLSITMIAVTLGDGYPLPSTINFAQPNTLRGVVTDVGVLTLRVKAVDLYSEAYALIDVNSSNHAPVVTSSWDPIRVLAGVPFSAVRYHSGKLMDADPSDQIACSVDLASVSSIPWVSVATISPGTLQISGTPPSGQSIAIDDVGNQSISMSSSSSLFPHDKNITIRLICSDGVSSVNASLQLHMQEALTPLLTAWLPNITASAEDVLQTTIDVALFFRDPAGGTVMLGAVAPGADGLAVWLQLQRVSDTVLQLSGVPPVDQAGGTTSGTTFPLLIKVRNVFGNETNATMLITVTATAWQLVQAYSALIYSLFGLLLTAVSFWFYWVPIVNTVMLPWRRTPCPLLRAPDAAGKATPGTDGKGTHDEHDDELNEDEDGVVSFAVYKTCHDLVGYVKLPHKVAGRLRRCFGCVGVLASYWDLQVSYDRKLPKWLYLRGDGRVVFCADGGDDGIDDTVVIHEVNVYGVVLREYSCRYADVAAHLAEGGVPLVARSLNCNDSGGNQRRRLTSGGGVALPLVEHEADDHLELDDLNLLIEDVEAVGGSDHTLRRDSHPAAVAEASLRDIRRQHLKMDVMRRQLTQQLQASEIGINAHVDERLEVRVGEVTAKLDALSALILSRLSGGDPFSHFDSVSKVRSNEMFQWSNRSPGNGSGGGGGDLLLGSQHFYGGNEDPNRIRDPLAELNRALKSTGDQKGGALL
jgi:hypothetical protein